LTEFKIKYFTFDNEYIILYICFSTQIDNMLVKMLLFTALSANHVFAVCTKSTDRRNVSMIQQIRRLNLY